MPTPIMARLQSRSFALGTLPQSSTWIQQSNGNLFWLKPYH